MPLRNPFRRSEVQNENAPPQRDVADRQFQKTAVVGSTPIEIKEPIEFKLSEINDSGVFMPPSPTEKKAFWHTSSRTSTSSNHRSLLSENEPFNMSRESFDSYRRSFDISARSPVPEFDQRPRQSLDSRRTTFQSRPSFDRYIDRTGPTAEEPAGFEDVGLNDEAKPQQKKRSIFSRFGDSNNTSDKDANAQDQRPSSSHHSFPFIGRKRGQSGQGSELRSMGQKQEVQAA